jgi:hypothetical protein
MKRAPYFDSDLHASRVRDTKISQSHVFDERPSPALRTTPPPLSLAANPTSPIRVVPCAHTHAQNKGALFALPFTKSCRTSAAQRPAIHPPSTLPPSLPGQLCSPQPRSSTAHFGYGAPFCHFPSVSFCRLTNFFQLLNLPRRHYSSYRTLVQRPPVRVFIGNRKAVVNVSHRSVRSVQASGGSLPPCSVLFVLSPRCRLLLSVAT